MIKGPESGITRGQGISTMINNISKILLQPKENVPSRKTSGKRNTKYNSSRSMKSFIETSWTPKEPRDQEIQISKELYQIRGSPV